MGKLLIVGMPEPDDGRLWCAVCVGDYKQALVEAIGIDAAWAEQNINQTPPDHLKVIGPADAPKGFRWPTMGHAVTMTFVPHMGAVVGVCWTHATAIRQDVDELPPGFRRPGLIQGMS